MIIKGMEIINGSWLGKEKLFEVPSVYIQGLLQQKWLRAECNAEVFSAIGYALIFGVGLSKVLGGRSHWSDFYTT